MIRPVVHCMLSAGLVLASQAAWADRDELEPPDAEATRRIAAYINSGDCPGAVRQLNAEIKSRQRDVLLLAGAMFETGLCVKPNWDRGIHFYQLAERAGHPSAVLRLASGYAVAGRDNAMALWWMAQRPGGMPRACIPAADPLEDAAGFESALAAMPQSQRQSCIYMTGVYASILAETEFPAPASINNVFGDLDMVFNAADGTVSWTQVTLEQATQPGVADGPAGLAFSRETVEDTLLSYMRGISDRSLARYQKPESVDPGMRIKQRISFYYH
ncbi:hypothetical protein KY495_10185 [Massilia sp. PAMC28688]|uniref:hypothetical protein n=1 Tax=Massilia sp. PAMC28688 TaxID=2861283 RepID=UPI001C629ED2|nr:hypothetical protein [Massilia sp. PAMC28688]QYF95475.1 hypothetical protein KY495_10185 [Massilia sp. PAMC28688]